MSADLKRGMTTTDRINQVVSIPVSLVAFAFTMGALGSPPATARPIAAEAAEMMMEVQLQDQLLIQAAIPWNPTDAVSYAYVYSTDTGAFSFSTMAGQSIAGLPFRFSTTAQSDAQNGTWYWSGTGVAGGTSFQITGGGNMQFAALGDFETAGGDDKHDIEGKYHDDKDKEYNATATVKVEDSGHGEQSEGTGVVKNKDGTVVKQGKVHDFRVLEGDKFRWEITFDAADGTKAHGFGSDAPIGTTEFQGDFTQTSSVPEPCSLLLLGSGLLSVVAENMRRKRRC